MAFVTPTGYPFDETAEDQITKIYESEWNNLRGAVNDLVVDALAGGGGSPQIVLIDGNWYSNAMLFGARETGGFNPIPQLVYATPVYIPAAGVITGLATYVDTEIAATAGSLGIWTDRADGAPDALLDAGAIDTTIQGWREATGISATVSAGTYWVGITVNSNFIVLGTFQFENISPLGRSAPDQDSLATATMGGITGTTLTNWSATVPSDYWTGPAGTSYPRVQFQWSAS